MNQFPAVLAKEFAREQAQPWVVENDFFVLAAPDAYIADIIDMACNEASIAEFGCDEVCLLEVFVTHTQEELQAGRAKWVLEQSRAALRARGVPVGAPARRPSRPSRLSSAQAPRLPRGAARVRRRRRKSEIGLSAAEQAAGGRWTRREDLPLQAASGTACPEAPHCPDFVPAWALGQAIAVDASS